MVQKGMAAYDCAERVASYDADMEIMHPNRAKMVHVAMDCRPGGKASEEAGSEQGQRNSGAEEKKTTAKGLSPRARVAAARPGIMADQHLSNPKRWDGIVQH